MDWHKVLEDGYPIKEGLYLLKYEGVGTPRMAFLHNNVITTHTLLRNIVEWRRVA